MPWRDLHCLAVAALADRPCRRCQQRAKTIARDGSIDLRKPWRRR